MNNCNQVIDLKRPSGSYKVRWFQPPWRTVFEYACPKCGNKVRLFASAFSGNRPGPGVGGVVCGGIIAEEEKHEQL